MPASIRRLVRGVLLGLAVTASIAALRTALTPILGDRASLMPFLLAVLAAAGTGGFAAGVLTTTLGLLAGGILFAGSPLPVNAQQAIPAAFYLGVGLAISVLLESLYRARRQAERRERDLDLVTNRTPQMLVRFGRDLRYRYVNRAGAEFLRLPVETIVGRSIAEVMGDEAYAALEPQIRRVLGGRDVEFDVELPYADIGMRSLHVLYVPDRDVHGEVVGWVATMSDFSERRRTEAALRESEIRLATFLDQLPVGAGLIDREGRYVLGNELHRRYAEEADPAVEPAHAPRWQVWKDDGTPLERTEWPGARALRGMVSAGVDFLFTGDDGVQKWMRVSAAPFRNEAGDLAGAITIIEDVDVAKRGEEAIREADRRKDEFLAILAHELRNPLAPVRNAAHFLRLHGPANPEMQRPIELIERQVGQMSRLIDDLLDVSRISRGILTLRRERVELEALTKAVIEACRDEVDGRLHTLNVLLPEEPVAFSADRHRLSQVFCNLISNASKYTPAGGVIEFKARVSHDHLEILVRDNGVGIPAEKLGEIFELFAQVDRSIERQGGLGIGLTLARQLIELHGGTIEARSEGLGKGSTFVVKIPIMTATVAREADVEGPAARISPRRILVADDNRDAAESLVMLLEVAGHEVRFALDGEAAVRLAETFMPEAAILDIGMPKLNGYETARRIRADERLRSMYLVALTGWGQERDVHEALAAGFDAHLVKPANPEALYRLLAGLGKRAEPTLDAAR